jgi:hypothetical protein
MAARVFVLKEKMRKNKEALEAALEDDEEDEFHKLDENAQFANVLAAVM